MIDERLEEQASLYALGILEPDEKPEFERELEGNEELQRLVDDLSAAAASLAHNVPLRMPPPHLEAAILREIRESKVVRPAFTPARWVPWALAAGLAVTTGVLFVSRTELKNRVADLRSEQAQAQAEVARLSAERDKTVGKLADLEKREAESNARISAFNREREQMIGEIAQLKERDSFSQMQIATLSSKLEAAPKASAFVIWDAKNQRGVLTAVDVPPNAEDHDYQLWVVDPKYQIPVDAGVFSVKNGQTTKVVFKPKRPITSADAFAVSLERKGGVAKAEGPMVLVGK